MSTKSLLKWSCVLAETAALTAGQTQRLSAAFPPHVTVSGDFVISSDKHRSQALNQEDARKRLIDMLLAIRRPPKTRVKTKPSRGPKLRRLEQKKLRTQVKQGRKRVDY